MESPDLRRHITRTYINLRVGMGVMAFAFPLLLWLGGLYFKVERQGSISAYYHTPMRDFYVGILIAIGSFLFLYKGFTRQENWALNLAGIFAAGVAFIPTSTSSSAQFEITAHGVCTVSFFLSIAYVCLFRSNDTLRLIRDAAVARRYRYQYKVIGILMVVLPVAAAFWTSSLPSLLRVDRKIDVFFVECAAVWVFSLYWLVKSRELSLHTDGLELRMISEI